MNAVPWKTVSVGVSILIAMVSLVFGGLWELVIPGSVMLAAILMVGKQEGSDLYIIAVGQLLVYGASYGSFFIAVICEFCLFAAIIGKTQKKMLVILFIMLTIIGIIAQMIYHTGWWIAGLIVLCSLLVISGHIRKEALSRSLRGQKDE